MSIIFLHFHYFDVVLLVRVLPLFVDIDQLLVQQDIAVFPETILSGADAVQHVIDVVVAKRLPRVVLKKRSSARKSYNCPSRLHTSDLASVTKFLADFQKLD